MTSLDRRVAVGTARMLAARRDAIASGAEPLGWKAGFGAPASLTSLAIDRPLVGFLTRDRLLDDGAAVDVSSWRRPRLEAEVAAHLAADIGPGASPAEALAAVGGWSVAIELADLDRPPDGPDDIERVLVGNVFHRHVLLGPVVPARPSSLSFAVSRDGAEVARTSSPEQLTGELGFVLASMADTLAACGAGLRAGDVVITGSVVSPIPVENGATWLVDAGGLGRVGVALG